MTEPHDYCDSATGHVLGIKHHLERLDPDSTEGCQLQAAPRTYLPGDREAWEAEILRLREVEGWEGERDSVRRDFSQLPTAERCIRRLRAGETLEDADLFELKRFCFYGRNIAAACVDLLDDSDLEDRLAAYMQVLHPESTPSPRFHLSSSLDSELSEARADLQRVRGEEKARRQELERCVIEEIGGRFDVRGRYHAPSGVDPSAHPALTRRDDAWRLSAGDTATLSQQLEELRATLEAIERRVREKISDRLRPAADWFEEASRQLARLDLRMAKVRLLREIGGCWGRWKEEPGMRIESGRQPSLAQRLKLSSETVQPIDFETGARPVVVTGPNMGGKSALLELLGLCQWCAQHAMPVPAAHFEFEPVWSVIYVGSEEPAALAASAGLSSFGREVRRLVSWWDGPHPRQWLLDEVGRGTHPEEGADIAREVIERLVENGDRVVATTHFPGVAAMDDCRRFHIAGLTDRERLRDLLADADDDLQEIQSALRATMDYRPVATEAKDVPRDARAVARALGLDVDDS